MVLERMEQKTQQMGIEIHSLHYGHSDGHTDICYSEDGSKLISCGGDGDIRVWNGFDDEDPVQTCLGEFVLCVRQKNEQILVGTDSNSVQLVSYPSGVRDGVLTRFTGHVNHIGLGASHNWVALASEDMTVKLVELSSKETKIFSDFGGPALSVALCSKVEHLAVSCGDGKLRIFKIAEQTVVKELEVVHKTNSFVNAKYLSRIDFDQKHGLYFAYPHGKKIVILNTSDWLEAYALSADFIDDSFSILSFSSCGNYIAAASLDGYLVVWNLRTQIMVGEVRHEKGIAITAIAWNPKGNGELAFADAEGYVGLARTRKTEKIPLELPTNTSETVDFGDVQIEEEDDEDNENAVSLEKLKSDILGTSGDKEDFDGKSEKNSSRCSSPTPSARYVEEPLQESFMPSSTPEHLDPRYMCWNDVGVIRSYGGRLDIDDEGTRSIEVEFHDSTFHNSMMMSNYQGYTMGSISTSALVIANNNVMHVVPLMSHSKEWHLNYPDSEQIVGVTSSQSLVCCAMANNLVYVCTTFGTQKCVLSVPGPIVCINSFGHVLMVAYHSSSPRGKDQCIEIMLIKTEGTSIENRNLKTAMSPGAKLQWAGFTDVGTPALMDSEGMIFLYPLRSNLWIPLCDTSKQCKGPADGFFLTAISESLGTVRGVLCKGTMYPGFIPRPTVCEIDLEPPLAEPGTEKTQLETDFFKSCVLQMEHGDKKYKETALKIFALAAKNNLDQRALEFMELLENDQLTTLGVKYANKLEKRRLAEKLTELAEKLSASANAADSEVVDGFSKAGKKGQEETTSTPTNVIKPNKKLFLNSTNKILSKRKITGNSSNQDNSLNLSESESFQDSINMPSGSGLDTQNSSATKQDCKNPFLKSLNKPNVSVHNPLSLTDKFAGFDEESIEKENSRIGSKPEAAEKRKKSDSSPQEKGKEKQRKLDKFMFTKRT